MKISELQCRVPNIQCDHCRKADARMSAVLDVMYSAKCTTWASSVWFIAPHGKNCDIVISKLLMTLYTSFSNTVL